tara:strand:- start:285 stop:494 length:210 start_codon:yes stop_codon:yes gene_type:complete
MRGILFPSESATQAEIMAEAFANKSIWDMRWYKFKLWFYTSLTGFLFMFFTSMLESFFDFSLFEWLFGL